jgi:hypothetical protein
MAFNRKARELLVFAGADVIVPSHDWWLYQLVSACGGEVHYDSHPYVRYRQHTANIIGSNVGLAARLRRLQMLQKGRFREWTDLNEAALMRVRPRMTPQNRETFDLFRIARRSSLLRRAAIFAKAGIYRQTVLGNLGLAAAVVLKKI